MYGGMAIVFKIVSNFLQVLPIARYCAMSTLLPLRLSSAACPELMIAKLDNV